MVRAFEPPVYCYHEIVHNKLVVDRFRDQGVVFVDDIAEVPARAARSCCRPTVRPPRSSRRPSEGQLRRRQRVPARHQGPPRGQGPRRQGLSHRLRRPRGARGSGRARWPSRPTAIHRVESVAEVAALPQFDQPVALLAQTTLSHRDWADVAEATQLKLPGAVGAGTERPVLRHHQPPVGVDGAWRPAATPSSSSARPTRRTPGRSRSWPATPVAARSIGSTTSTSCPIDLCGIVGVTAGASAPRNSSNAVIARLAPRRGRRGGPGHRGGRVLPAAAQHP